MCIIVKFKEQRSKKKVYGARNACQTHTHTRSTPARRLYARKT